MRSGTDGWTLREVQVGSKVLVGGPGWTGNPGKGLGRVGDYLWRSGMGRGTIREVQDGLGTLGMSGMG